ncbi:MAG: aspartate/glutamate racemase family protein [Bacillota bacterium]
MKKIGLIGGMSWESSLEYYRLLNQFTKEELGEPHSAELIMYSVDFARFERMQHKGQWQEMADEMIEIARKLKGAGAELLLICTNTMHKLAPAIEENVEIELIHIADATGEAILSQALTTVGLLGTNFTMTEDFYKNRLEENYNINVIIPEAREREIVHDTIYKELISGIIKEESLNRFQEIINNLKAEGAEGVILGCTEIPLLVKEKDSSLPIFNTMEIHARKAIEQALNSN